MFNCCWNTALSYEDIWCNAAKVMPVLAQPDHPRGVETNLDIKSESNWSYHFQCKQKLNDLKITASKKKTTNQTHILPAASFGSYKWEFWSFDLILPGRLCLQKACFPRNFDNPVILGEREWSAQWMIYFPTKCWSYLESPRNPKITRVDTMPSSTWNKPSLRDY